MKPVRNNNSKWKVKNNKEKTNKNSDMEKLVLQIFKVLKLRLMIDNIEIPNDKIKEEIEINLNTININKFDLKNLNLLVDDLTTIIKENNKNQIKHESNNEKEYFNKNEEENYLNENTDEIETGALTNAIKDQSNIHPLTIMSLNRKEYINTNVPSKDNSKKQTHQNIPQKEPMKFSIVTYPKHINEGKPFYQENKRGNIVYSNNNVFTEIQERIIDKVIKKSKNNK